ncbi:MAG: hypothetical protein J6K31_10530 [Parabacteroides sp.]|nr:hypothetical protein [Parabacteroides sp.]
MRHSILQTATILFHLILLPCFIRAEGSVRLTLKDTSSAPKQAIEQNASALLSQINQAFDAKQSGLDLKEIDITDKAKESLASLWANVHFKCDDSDVIQDCLTTSSGFQVRQIPLLIEPQGATTADDSYQEAVINFEPSGQISSFYFTIGTNLYSKVMSSKKEVTDIRRRMQILDYVEHFRTAYNQKDINFLEQVFSDDALIIVGKVVKTQPADINNFVGQTKVEFIKRTKQEYLNNLKKTFVANKFINVKFDEIKVVRHPNPAKKDFYGVTLHQLYSSSTYSDDGYLFLLWDFKEEDSPKIHVRTWQPKYTDNSKSQIATPEDKIFTISDFEIDIDI